MKISYVNIKNFRSISDVQIDFDHGCQVLIGINESGKSNILKALNLLDPNVSIGQNDLRIDRKDEEPVLEGEVAFKLSLDDVEVSQVYETIRRRFEETSLTRPLLVIGRRPADLGALCRDLAFGAVTVHVPSGQRLITPWVLSTEAKGISGWHQSEIDQPMQLEIGGRQISIPPRGFVHASDLGEYADVPDLVPLDLEMLVSKIGDEVRGIVVDRMPICIFWKYSDQYLLPSSIDVNAFCSNPSSCEPLKAMFELAGYPSNRLTEIIQTVRTQPAHRYLQLLDKVGHATTEYIRSVWKDHQSVRVDLAANGDLLIPVVVDSEVRLDMASRSDGFKRLVSFLLQISAKVRSKELKNFLLLVDEPEVALHPGGAKSLMHELIQIGESDSVVYSTHSIFMIDVENVGRHWIVEKKSEVTEVSRADVSRVQDEEVLYKAIGYSIFESLKERNVIFEGWRDKEFFRVLRDAMMKSQEALKPQLGRIGLTFAEGVKDVCNVARLLELASRPCLILSDSDAPAIERKHTFEAAKIWGQWFTLAEVLRDATIVTTEDLIAREALVRRANAFRNSNENIPELTLADVPLDAAVIPALERWLRNGGMSEKSSIKAAMSALKTVLFDGLDRSEIRDCAEGLVEFVMAHDFSPR